ncbi:sensor histidine kinase [Derxia gummosa]|uniref:histidine kinase n=1 Tax=Derxia gummosa DSM 723 TaxID=1121388 RepID=A0A8B6X8Y2_9BURK|nr:histidine kinase [Derxia gummosa]
MTWQLAGFHAALLAGVLAASVVNLDADAREELRAANDLARVVAAAARTDALAGLRADTHAATRPVGATGHADHAAAAVHARNTPGLADHPADRPLPDLLADTRSRHLALRLEPRTADHDAAIAVGDHRLPAGDHWLVLRPDGAGERAEKLRDAARLLLPLLLVSVATVLAARAAVGRALMPVRELVAGLARLERGERAAVLPRFDLPEFARVAEAIDRLARHLDTARAAEQHLTRRLIETQDAERRALARDLHDELGQSLTAVGLAAGYLARHPDAGPARVRECADEISGEVRRLHGQLRSMLARLRPHGLEGLGLAAALDELVEGFARRPRGPRITHRLPMVLPPLEPAAALALFRLVQEALTNVLRHAGARRVKVALDVRGDLVEASVEDDGGGRAEHVLRAASSGVTGMRERLAMAGGSLGLLDLAPRGLKVIGRVPRAPGDAAAAGAPERTPASVAVEAGVMDAAGPRSGAAS